MSDVSRPYEPAMHPLDKSGGSLNQLQIATAMSTADGLWFTTHRHGRRAWKCRITAASVRGVERRYLAVGP
jgi:hypothetical protein